MVRLGPQAALVSLTIAHGQRQISTGEPGEKKGLGRQRARSMAGGCEDAEVEPWSGRTTSASPRREDTHWRNSVWRQSGMQAGRAGDRIATGRLTREEAASLLWNVFLGGHAVLYREILGSGKGAGCPFLSEGV